MTDTEALLAERLAEMMFGQPVSRGQLEEARRMVQTDPGQRLLGYLEGLLAPTERERADIRGASLWLSREEWGYVIDGLIAEVARADLRKSANPESTSDQRLHDIEALIARLYAALAAQPAPEEASCGAEMVEDMPCYLPSGHAGNHVGRSTR